MIDPLAIATSGYLDCPLSVVADGYLYCERDIIEKVGVFNGRNSNQIRKDRILKEDEEIMVLISAFMDVKQ